MGRLGVAPDRITINAQIDDAIKQERLDEAIDIFERALDGVSTDRNSNNPCNECTDKSLDCHRYGGAWSQHISHHTVSDVKSKNQEPGQDAHIFAARVCSL